MITGEVEIIITFYLFLLAGGEQAGEGRGGGGSRVFSPGLGTSPTWTVQPYLCGPGGSASARVWPLHQ